MLQGALAFCIIFTSLPVFAYRAAVVEFSPDNINENRIQNNLNGFLSALKSLGRGGSHITVFPEAGLLGLNVSINTRDAIYPDLEPIQKISQDGSPSINPCIDFGYSQNSILHQLSCFARDYETVIVANMGEVQNCSHIKGCPKDGRYQFNTNVVFESDGSLLAKYRKQNLYLREKQLYDPGTTDSSCVTFKTSFGITFGMMTCFDLLYKEPGDCMINKEHIKHVVLPTAWGNNYPFYMSIVVQQAWSMKHAVNFLAANVQYILSQGGKTKYVSSGSGIYSSGYVMEYFISDTSLSRASGRVLVADLPDDPSASTILSHHDGYINNIQKIKACTSGYLKYEFLKNKTGTLQVISEYKKTKSILMCTLKYSIKNDGLDETYAVGVYIGENPRDSTFGYAVCDLVKCKSGSIKDCGVPVSEYTAETIFDTLQLTGNFQVTSIGDVYAGALGSGLQLLSPSVLNMNGTSVSVVGYSKPLLSLSLWTRISVLIPDDRDHVQRYDWRWLGPLIAFIALIIAAMYCYKKKKYCFKHVEEDKQKLQ